MQSIRVDLPIECMLSFSWNYPFPYLDCGETLPNFFADLVMSRPTARGTGGWRQELAHKADKTQRHEKCHFDGVDPAVRVHAVLGHLRHLR